MKQLNLDSEKQFLQTQKINENPPLSSDPVADNPMADPEPEIKIQMDGLGRVEPKIKNENHPSLIGLPPTSKATKDEVILNIDPDRVCEPKGIKVGRWDVFNRDKEKKTPAFYYLITGAVLLTGSAVGIMLWIFVFSKPASFKSAATQNAALVLRNSTGSGMAGHQDGDSNSASFNYPNGVAADSDGNIYVADTGNNEIRKINVTGFVSTLAGNATAPPSFQDGQGSLALFNAPIGIASDPVTGFLYVVDSNNSLIRQIDPQTNQVSTVAGILSLRAGADDGQSTAASLNTPYGIAADSSQNLFVSDTGNNLVRQINASRYVRTFAGISTLSRRVSAALLINLKTPLGIALDSVGNLYVVDSGNFRIVKFNPSATSFNHVLNLTSTSTAAIAVDKNNSLWVSQPDSSNLQVVAQSGEVQSVPAPSTALSFLTFDPNGNVVSSISSLNVISVFAVVVSSESSTSTSLIESIVTSSVSTLAPSATTSTTDAVLDIMSSSAPSTSSSIISPKSGSSTIDRSSLSQSQSSLKSSSSTRTSTTTSVQITILSRSSTGSGSSTLTPKSSASSSVSSATTLSIIAQSSVNSKMLASTGPSLASATSSLVTSSTVLPANVASSTSSVPHSTSTVVSIELSPTLVAPSTSSSSSVVTSSTVVFAHTTSDVVFYGLSSTLTTAASIVSSTTSVPISALFTLSSAAATTTDAQSTSAMFLADSLVASSTVPAS